MTAWEYDHNWDTLTVDPHELPSCDVDHDGPCITSDGRVVVNELMTLVHRAWKRYLWSVRAHGGSCDECRYYSATSDKFGRCDAFCYGEPRGKIVPADHGCKRWERRD